MTTHDFYCYLLSEDFKDINSICRILSLKQIHFDDDPDIIFAIDTHTAKDSDIRKFLKSLNPDICRHYESFCYLVNDCFLFLQVSGHLFAFSFEDSYRSIQKYSVGDFGKVIGANLADRKYNCVRFKARYEDGTTLVGTFNAIHPKGIEYYEQLRDDSNLKDFQFLEMICKFDMEGVGKFLDGTDRVKFRAKADSAHDLKSFCEELIKHYTSSQKSD